MDDLIFPAPGSNLHTIAQHGFIPLFKFWVDQNNDLSSRPADEWASSKTFLKYVQDCFGQTDLDEVDELPTTAEGLYYFIFNDQISFVVDFIDDDRVTIATTNGQPMIYCENLNRHEWTSSFLDDLMNGLGGVFMRAKTPIDALIILH